MLICIRIGSCKQPTLGGPIPHNLAQTFDGPLTLERCGSEHRVGRLHPRFLRKRGLGRKWSSPCRRDGEVEKSLL